MGKVVVSAKVENYHDVVRADVGVLAPAEVRNVQLQDVLVDTGATMLSLPSATIRELGLMRRRTRTARTTAGMVSFGICDPVRLTVQNRECVVEVCEVPEDCPPLIGQVPLEMLDLVVDTVDQRLIGNPDHHGEQMIDMFRLCMGLNLRPRIGGAVPG